MIGLLRKSKETLPEFSFFGDPNHDVINAQIEVLENLEDFSSSTDVWQAFESDFREEHCSQIADIYEWYEGDRDDEDIVDID